MNPIEIRAPIWNGGKRVVGIAEHKLGTQLTDVKITYRNRFGSEIYPYVFAIDTVEARKFPTMILKNSGVVLRLIPIDALKIKEVR